MYLPSIFTDRNIALAFIHIDIKYKPYYTVHKIKSIYYIMN